MNQIPDTPPHGDFARYVEQLSAKAAAATLVKQAAAHAQPGGAAASASKGAASPSAPMPPPADAALSLWSVGKWVLIAWIAVQVVALLLPSSGFISVPLMLGLAAWLVLKFKKTSFQLLLTRLREMAEQAATEHKQRK